MIYVWEKVLGVMLQPPCDTMSAIRNIDARGPLRSQDRPWGEEWVNSLPAILAKVKAGNACARAAAKIARVCLKAGVPFVVENPRVSWLWNLPCWKGIVDDVRTTLCCADQCVYGAMWRKRTGLLAANICEQALQKLMWRCTGKRSCCSRTGRPHQLLIGTDGTGTCWTKRAQSYPLKLATNIANCLLDTARQKLLAENKFR